MKHYFIFNFSGEGINPNATSPTIISTSMSDSCSTDDIDVRFDIFVAAQMMDDCGAGSCVLTEVRTGDHLFTFWSFDSNVLDRQNRSNAIAINGPFYYSEYAGAGQCILLNGIDQYVVAPYIPLNNRSFTIEMFIFLNLFPKDTIFTILSQCASASATYQCLTLSVKNTKLFFGFSGEYQLGTTPLVHNRW